MSLKEKNAYDKLYSDELIEMVQTMLIGRLSEPTKPKKFSLFGYKDEPSAIKGRPDIERAIKLALDL